MILADTGYFIAVAIPSDQLHDRAVAWTLQLAEQVLVTESVLVEAINALSQTPLRSKSYRLAEQVSRDPLFHFVSAGPALLVPGLALHRARHDKEWSLTDCISFHVMREGDIVQALAFDHHFVQAGFEALLRRDPP